MSAAWARRAKSVSVVVVESRGPSRVVRLGLDYGASQAPISQRAARRVTPRASSTTPQGTALPSARLGLAASTMIGEHVGAEHKLKPVVVPTMSLAPKLKHTDAYVRTPPSDATGPEQYVPEAPDGRKIERSRSLPLPARP